VEIWERPPSMLRNIDDGPLGGVGAGDPGASTINAKKRRRRVPRPSRGVWSPSGVRKVSHDLHRHDRQKVILLMGPSLPALSFAMADDP
jgi:hypothetical protein